MINDYDLINSLLEDYSDESILKLNMILKLKEFDLSKVARSNMVKFFKLYLYDRDCYEKFVDTCKQNMFVFLTFKVIDNDHKLELKRKYRIQTSINRISFIDETPKEVIFELGELFPYLLPKKKS